MRERVLGMIMAGGEGRRLQILTSNVRAQPAVPFGGKYRIIDFVLSNFFNSGIKKIFVLIHHKSYSLVQHIEDNWLYRFGSQDEFIRIYGPMPPYWQKGTADCIYQNLSRIRIEDPDIVAVFAGDHIYRMDLQKMIEFHKEKESNLTICALRYPIKKAAGLFGILEIDEEKRVTGFEEKPERPASIPGDETRTWASMGNYLFDAKVLIDAVEYDSHLPDSQSWHDFAHDVIPRLIRTEGVKVYAYEFTDWTGKKETDGHLKPGYWRDIGCIDSYYEASMDLVGPNPLFDLYDKNWPIYSINTDNLPPPKFFAAPEDEKFSISHSMLSDGCILDECSITNSILSPEVEVHEGSAIKNSILFDNVKIGRHCLIDKAIIDKNVRIPDFTVISEGKITVSKSIPPSSHRKKHKGSEPHELGRRYIREHERQVEIFRDLVANSCTTNSGIVVIPRYYDMPVEMSLIE